MINFNVTDKMMHYVIEGLAMTLITVVTLAVLSMGVWELGIFVASIGAIAGIAGYDIHKKAKG